MTKVTRNILGDEPSDVISEVTGPGEPRSDPGERRKLITEDMFTREKASLVILSGRNVGRKYEVGDDLVIGRDARATVQLSFADVSRRHTRIERSRGDEFFIEDLDSRNGTRVNQIPIVKQRLSFGDRIQIGANTIFLFTYHNQIEEQLLQSQKMQSIGQLAGGIAHDFNNLLGAVLNNVDYLTNLPRSEPVGSADVRECLSDVRTAVARAVRLTSQLLGFACQGKYEEQPISVSELVLDVVTMVRRTFDRSIEVTHQVDPDLAVLGDHTQLNQVLMNLCLNARDAMPEGGALAIHAMRIDLDSLQALSLPFINPGEHVLLSVSDTGFGMDEDTCARAFDPFFTTKHIGQGTGLGLATVYGIIKNHDGNVQIVSAIGEGSTVKVFLPVLQTGKSNSDDTMPPPRKAQPLPRGAILVVDDEEVVRDSTRRLLGQLGYTRILLACDGVEAIELFREHAEDIAIVVLDLIMPRMGGVEAFDALREIAPDVAVVVASGYTDQDQAGQLIDRGARAFLPKPFDYKMLEDVLARIELEGAS